MSNTSNPSCAPAKAKQILWSPWGQLAPRGGGGLPQGGDDEDERLSLRKDVIYFICKNNKKLKLRIKKQAVWSTCPAY